MSLLGEGSLANESNHGLLSKIFTELRTVNKNLCCGNGGGGGGGGTFDGHIISDCTDPVYVSICQTGEFQPTDCDGNPVGPVLEVLPVLSVGKQTVHVCNIDEFATAVQGQLYNSVAQQETNSTPITIPGNTVHAISYKIISGTVDITIGATTLTYAAGEADSEQASTLITQTYVFTPVSGGKVKIKTIS